MPSTPFDSTALSERSRFYPAAFQGRVPKRIRMLRTVRSELPIAVTGRSIIADNGKEYDVLVNSHGAVAALLDDGYPFGLKPGEFEVVAWHDHTTQTASDVPNPKHTP